MEENYSDNSKILFIEMGIGEMGLIKFGINTLSKMDLQEILVFLIVVIMFLIGLTIYTRFLIKYR